MLPSSNLIPLGQRSLNVASFISKRYIRTPFGPPKRSFEDRNKQFLEAHQSKRLGLSEPLVGRPNQWKLLPKKPEPKIVQGERRLLSLKEAASPYEVYTEENINSIKEFEEFFDPLFNPHLGEKRYEINPEEEPFNAIYVDSKSESTSDYTKVRNITTPELWEYVERLERIKVAPRLETRKQSEPIEPLPSGFIPPPESPPDLPYFVPRTRNNLLPVYYHLGKEPEDCYTTVKQVTGDLWKLEQDLRSYLEEATKSKRRIITSVHEIDARVLFRGRHLQLIVDWLHQRGF